MMLDPYVRPFINPPLHHLAKRLISLGISSNTLTLSGFAAGLLAIAAITHHHPTLAALLFLLNRLFDGLDGAVARHSQTSDFGGILDVICDFIIYSGLVFAFGLADPENLYYAAFLLFSFIGPITTFLAYAIVAAKRKVHTTQRGIKSFYHLGGICEGTETALFLTLICLIPETFQWASMVFGGLCWLTTIGRVYRAYIDFAEPELTPMKTLVDHRQ